MALSASTVFDVRTGGLDTNSGAFDPAIAGATFDYTQQTGPQFSYTDLVIGSTTTNLTSAARPFSAADVGNSIRISAGVGFTVSTTPYMIVSVSGTIATMDRTVGVAASTGGTGKLGGALLTVAAAYVSAVVGNGVWVRSGVLTSVGDVFQTVVSTGASADIRTARMLWRELTNEKSTRSVPDYIVDKYIELGCKALNELIKYHYTDSTGIVLVADTQEYTLPTDFVEAWFFTWNGIELQRSSIAEWRRNNIRWQAEPSGFPQEWAIYRDKIVLRPKPNAAAVAVTAATTLRYINTPPTLIVNGLDQLLTQHQQIPVYKAVALWSAAHPDNMAAQQRIQYYEQLFKEEAAAALENYSLREVLR